MQGKLRNASDSIAPLILRDIIRNELFLRQADSAGVALTKAEMTGLRKELGTLVQSVNGTLGFVPAMMPDSVRRQDVAVRQRYLAARAEAAIENMVAKRGLVVQIPHPVRRLLRLCFPSASVSGDGIDSALEAARSIRTSADSARNAAPIDSPPAGVGPASPPADRKSAPAIKRKA